MVLLLSEIIYVISDPFFLPSMAFTTMMGLFIGAVIYNGDIREVKKMLLSLFSYALLIITVTLTRVVPQIPLEINGVQPGVHPFASIITIFTVTIFYLLGTYLGVRITKKAHNKKL